MCRFDAPTLNSATETVIAAPLHCNNDSNGDRARKEARRQVALVEGSTPHLSAETRDLLRNRLRIAAIMFFIGFLVFFVRWFFYWDEWFSRALPHVLSRMPRSRSCLARLRSVVPSLLVFVDEAAGRGARDFWLPGVIFLREGGIERRRIWPISRRPGAAAISSSRRGAADLHLRDVHSQHMATSSGGRRRDGADADRHLGILCTRTIPAIRRTCCSDSTTAASSAARF